MLGKVTCTAEFAALFVSTCSGRAMTSPEPAVAVPDGTSTATKPVTCVVGELMVFTTTPELEPATTALEAELLLADAEVITDAEVAAGAGAGALLTAAGALLLAYTVNVGGA